MQLEGLPLGIASCQGAAPILRYADPFPALPYRAPKSKTPTATVSLKTYEAKSSKYVAPIPGISIFFHWIVATF